MIDETNRSFNLWKMLVILAHRRKFIIGFVLICTITAIVIALIFPKSYRAKTSILPSQYDQQIGISGNFAQYSLTSAGFELPIMATPSDVYATMLMSQTVGRAVIKEMNLQDYFKDASVQGCLEILSDRTHIRVTGEGVIELFYEDRDPEMAARIANNYVANLDILNRQVKASKAKSDREFVFKRLESSRSALDSARVRLLKFQTDNKAVDLEKQRDLAINAASNLKSELALKSVSLDMKKKTFSPDHPEVRILQNEVDELKRQLSAIEDGNGEKSYLNLPLSDIPQLTLRYAELKAEVNLQEKVCELLTELHEEAGIKEQRDTPTISILETAYPPEIKFKPQRTIIVLAAFFGSLILALFIALFADYLENLRRTSPSDFELMNQARKEITGKTGFSDS